MILTITLNPSVDISYKLDQLNIDEVNRVSEVSKTAGGKGLNVSRVINQLDEEVAASGFLGGSLGGFIREEIFQFGINDCFINIKGETRNCIAIIHDGQQTEILESGPKISEAESNRFIDNFTHMVQQVNLITVSGSLPKGIDGDFYGQLIEIAHKFGTPVLLDTSGKTLKNTLESKFKPFLIKPNQDEIADLVEEPVKDLSHLSSILHSTIFKGIPWVVTTLGANGALVKHEEKIYHIYIPKINVINPVGSGDSVIAGFAAGISQGFKNEKLIKYAISMGILNTMEEKTGHININSLEWCLSNIEIEEIKK